MKNPAFDGTGLSRLEISFSFKPKHARKNGNDLRDEDRCIEPGNIPRVSKLMALAIRLMSGVTSCGGTSRISEAVRR